MGTRAEVLNVLHSGGVVILPTETVYGVAARADRPEAVNRLYAIKGRDFDKPLALCVSGMDAAKHYVTFDRLAKRMAKKFWPGPLTLVLPARDPSLFTRLAPQLYSTAPDGTPTIAIRCPDAIWRTETTFAKIEYPVALTSANRSGEPAPTKASQASKSLGYEVDDMLLLDDCPMEEASTIVSLAESPPRLLREGALPLSALKPFGIT